MTAIIEHPNPSIYETTVVEVDGQIVTHRDVEAIAARPRWDLSEAKERLEPSVQEVVATKVLPDPLGIDSAPKKKRTSAATSSSRSVQSVPIKKKR